MKKVNELNALIKEEGKELADNIVFDQEGQKLFIEDDDAEDTDSAHLLETYGVYEAYDFLKANNLLK